MFIKSKQVKFKICFVFVVPPNQMKMNAECSPCVRSVVFPLSNFMWVTPRKRSLANIHGESEPRVHLINSGTSTSGEGSLPLSDVRAHLGCAYLDK